jgi:hypothetical protein
MKPERTLAGGAGNISRSTGGVRALPSSNACAHPKSQGADDHICVTEVPVAVSPNFCG